MLSLVSAWRSSGRTRKDFCAEHDIKEGTFAYWVSKDRQSGADAVGFIPIGPGPVAGPIEIIYPNGVRLKMGNDLGLLARLIHIY